jgi:hypothetical protein
MPTGIYPHKRGYSCPQRGKRNPPPSILRPCANSKCKKLCKNKFCSIRCFNTGRVRPHLRYPDNVEKRLLRSKKRPFESLFTNLKYWARAAKRPVTLTYEGFFEFTKYRPITQY